MTHGQIASSIQPSLSMELDGSADSLALSGPGVSDALRHQGLQPTQ